MSARLGGFIAGQNINVSIGTVTFANTPDLTFASAAGTPAVGQPVQFTTTGTLPTGFSTNTTYYVISVSSNTCQVSTTQGGSATTYTNGTGSGTHTAVTQQIFNPYAGAPATVEYLVVAGGGGGGRQAGGGGGAGGVLTATGYAITSGSAITVTVGAGGVGQSSGNAPSVSNGSNSIFGAITTTGGGGGAGYNEGVTSQVGANGGSGGGSWSNAATSSGTSGQGNAGAAGAALGSYSETSGGGGGAGSAGGSGTSSTSGNGGAGICSTITGARVFYAGGGGAGGPSSNNGGSAGGSFGTGGAGGGTGGNSSSGNGGGFSGVSNTGGGGGGSAFSGTPGTIAVAGAGGSGIVIIRYPQVNSAPALVTGAPQLSYADGYQIYTWTSSGSIIF